MIDVHNFRFQLNDGGVSTSTTGSRSSALSCPRPMTREYESLFFRSAFPSSSSSLPPCLTSRLPFSHFFHPLPSRFSSFLFFAFAFCTFPTDHYFLFVTLYDELVQVRCLRREAFTGSPFFVSSTLLSFTFLPLSLFTAVRSSFLYFNFVSHLPFRAKAPHFLVLDVLHLVNEGKWEGRGCCKPEIQENEIKKDYSIYSSYYRVFYYSARHTHFRVLHKVLNKINLL